MVNSDFGLTKHSDDLFIVVRSGPETEELDRGN